MRVLKKDLIAKVAQLESDLMELVLNPNSERSMIIKIQYTMKDGVEKLLWLGSPTKETVTFDGFLNKINGQD